MDEANHTQLSAGLATQINEAHRLTQEHLGKTILFAIEAGRLLTEAKAATPHGRWLPWLRENITFSERTAQAYMTVHRRWGRNPQRVADLPLRKALAEAAHPGRVEAREQIQMEAETPVPNKSLDALKALGADFEKVFAWFAEAHEAPFNARDLELDQISPDWIRNKLFDKLEVPVVADVFLRDDFAPISLLRLLDFDDLIDAGNLLVAVANGESLPVIDTFGMGATQLTKIAWIMQVEASAALGGLIKEYEHRKTITDEQFEAEWTDTHTRFMSTVDARLKAVRENRAKNERAEFQTEEEAFADLDRAMKLPPDEVSA